jgi:hypothetical protein
VYVGSDGRFRALQVHIPYDAPVDVRL